MTTVDEGTAGFANAAHHTYFIPMVDMLAGVVFLLVIMLAASMLVSRPEFAQTEAMEQEMARIQADLDKARTTDRLYLEPRRRARAATELLLTRISDDLRRSGIETVASPDTGTLIFAARELFTERGLNAEGDKLVKALSAALAIELPCLAAAGSASAACADYREVRLQTVALTVPAEADAGKTKVNALRLLTGIGDAQPPLLALTERGGSDLMTYAIGKSGDPFVLRVDMAVPAIR
jgi:hypothetical protein